MFQGAEYGRENHAFVLHPMARPCVRPLVAIVKHLSTDAGFAEFPERHELVLDEPCQPSTTPTVRGDSLWGPTDPLHDSCRAPRVSKPLTGRKRLILQWRHEHPSTRAPASRPRRC